ncbi:MAG TPA: OPT/YSL family transporter [Gemmataceae bacterium]|nr:OPT/YSL family transporter [Gemmataceae bacterium]
MRRELTWQSVVSAVVVSALVSASYPYVVLKLGLGPNVSVVSAFLGALMLLALAPKTHGQNRWMNNVVQTAGTSAASTAFMCVVAAAVDLAAQNPNATPYLNGITHIDPWPMFWWLCCAGGIGVLFTVLFRRHFLDDPKMVFADGVAAAETIVILDSKGGAARSKLQLLGLTALASALVDWFREGMEVLPDLYPGRVYKSLKVGIEWNLLSVGSGLLIGLNVSLSMLAATAVVRLAGPHLIEVGIGREIVLSNVGDRQVPNMHLVTSLGVLGARTPLEAATLAAVSREGGEIAPPLVDTRKECEQLIDKPWDELSFHERAFVAVYGNKQADYMQQKYFSIMLLWFMWPATGLMITSAITAVLLKWRSIAESFRHLRVSAAGGQSEDVSLGSVALGSVLLTVALAVVARLYFNMSPVQTVLAVVCSLPLILVGIRVLGETNNGPISVMMNGLQAVFAVFWPSSIGHNLVAAGMAGSCNAQGQGTIQDYKTGKIIGSTPRILTWVQLAAVPIGAAAVAVMYPLLTTRYRLGEELTTPTGVKIANMAVLLSQGWGALPRGAVLWTVIAAVVGIVIPVIQHFRRVEWLPSAAGFGFGLILPGTLNIPMALGGILGWLWARQHRRSYDRYVVTVASGFIAGEALIGGLIIPALSWFFPKLFGG